jgi:hypothetical protein
MPELHDICAAVYAREMIGKVTQYCEREASKKNFASSTEQGKQMGSKSSECITVPY